MTVTISIPILVAICTMVLFTAALWKNYNGKRDCFGIEAGIRMLLTFIVYLLILVCIFAGEHFKWWNL